MSVEPRPRLTLRRLAVVCGLVLLGIACDLGPARSGTPPIPELLDREDPEVVDLVQELVAGIGVAPDDATRWAALGMAYEANRMVDLARQCYARAVTLDPSEPRSWYRLALVRSVLGDVDGAISAARRVVALDVAYAPVYGQLGSWLLDRLDTSGAAEAFRRVSELAPREPAGHVGLARVALLQGEPERAISSLERVLAAYPDHPQARLLLETAYRQSGRAGQATLGPAGRRSYVSPDPWTDELAQYRRGAGAVREEAMRLFRSGQFDRAAQLFERLLEDRPNDFTLLNQLGASYVSAGRADPALAVLHDALALHPDHFEAHFNLAGAYMGKQEVDRALQHADRAIAISPEHPRGYERKGTLLVRAQRYEEAMAAFRLAVRFDPRNLTALMSLAMLHYNVDELSAALEFFDRARREDPTVVEAHVGLAMVHMDRGDLTRAATALEPAGRLDPDQPQLVTARQRLRTLRARRPSSR